MNKVKKAIGYMIYFFVGSPLPHYGLGRKWKVAKAIRGISAKLLFDKCGKNIDIGRHCKLSSTITIGNNSGIGDYSYIQGKVTIGNNVMMAPSVAIIANNHNIEGLDIPMNKQGENEAPICIKDDVCIGYGAIILGGVTVNTGAVIAAGSIVTKDVPEYSVVGGTPAKVIKWRKENNKYEKCTVG